MRVKNLAVTLPGQRVGSISQNRAGLTQWMPDEGWEANGQKPRLGLDFLRRLGPRSHASDLPAWFENLLPERESPLRLRLSQLYNLREGQSFELLKAVGHDLIGAVEVKPSDGAYQDELPRAVADKDGSEGELKLDRLSALTGMQLKFSMSMVNERLVLSAKSNSSSWIVKLAGAEYDELAEVEHTTMTWAQHAGFSVPPCFVVPFDQLHGLPRDWVERPTPALAIRRFDRRADGSKIHQEDLCQALGIRSREKYGDQDSRIGFDGALRLVSDACGLEDGHEMARRIGFMIASGNSDAHLKNWALLWGDRLRPRLAPCFDLVATVSWPSKLGWERRGGPRLALHLGNESSFRNLSMLALDRLVASTSFTWARSSILDGIERAKATWPEVEPSAPTRMRDAILQHWEAVPLLETVGLH